LISTGSDRAIGELSLADRIRVAREVGLEIAEHMLDKGAARLIEAARAESAEHGWK
jgi:hypothetical protein